MPRDTANIFIKLSGNYYKVFKKLTSEALKYETGKVYHGNGYAVIFIEV